MELNKDIKNKLDENDWNSIYKQMLAFAYYLKNQHEGRDGDFPLGWTPEDIVQTVIKKAYSGERGWKPDKGPLVPWLIQVIRSVVSAVYDKATDQHGQRRETQHLGASDNGVLDEYNNAQLLEHSVDDIFPNMKSLSPEKRIISEEERRRKNSIIEQIISDDEELFQLYEAMSNGKTYETRPRKLAEIMGVKVQQIYKLKRRLLARIDQDKHKMKMDDQNE